MKKFKRVFLTVLDSVGIGALNDAKEYGDEGANTLCNIAKATGGLNLPNMQKMGLGNIQKIDGVKSVENQTAYSTKCGELSKGKDTITGHWEMAGILIKEPFRVFTDTGFPNELIDELEEKSGHKFIGNISASGTEIIKNLGEEHIQSKALILYTSADSVLQIAANEEIIPLQELYRVCEIAREITLQEEYKVGRIIARPFVGTNKENFKRTANRKDYALRPPKNTILDVLKEKDLDVVGIGKIGDIYSYQGITKSIKSKSNEDGINELINIAKENLYEGLVFLNLVDFDALFGHRRDPIGYKNALESFDKKLGELIKEMNDDDLLIITADHGNDPTFKGTDHTREYVPVLIYNKNLENPIKLNELKSMADIGMTILNNFNDDNKEYDFEIGKSFLELIK
ncbi:MAG: phosphopentomutase [Terrisporobacter othiniensis]|uniref:phosphopentomutase n=1 Tax=Terrisporobacter petrolearius TaxID=1460447 RepID=UPI0022E850E5|nr:phosphopentomutase [Terrisporobacter petrolearius]MDU4860435.1 phosphopentomutase [Terrisporobacter othiniensis]MDU6993336.1 phosphopentomutase [Terrisporobacter othiniensis]